MTHLRSAINRERPEEVETMAKNTGRGFRRGAVRGRSEFRHPNGTYVKRDRSTGRIMNVSRSPHKGVTDE